MRELLEALADGELTPREVEASLRGYVEGISGRYDAARPARRGIPEAILAEGKTPSEVVELVELALETTEMALVTRADVQVRERVKEHVSDAFPDTTVRVDARARAMAIRRAPPSQIDACVGIVTGGTADAQAAREASLTLSVVGVDAELIEDVGVASIDRLLDQVEHLRSCDVLIVAAGREGSLPTVVAGLVEAPVIALPVSSGYGEGGAGEAALLSALQSCTVLTTVNIDAGFVAGAQAALIANAISSVR